METKQRVNCWEARECGRGPGSAEPCPAALDVTSAGVNGGLNAGRICWTVPRTSCHDRPHGDFVDKLEVCENCEFLHRVRKEEGEGFRFVKLAQGLREAEALHERIAQIESLMDIHESLRKRFDFDAVIGEITRQARAVTQAQRSIVLLLQGDPPRLRGRFRLRRQPIEVDIPYDETSAVGCAVVRNTTVNIRNAYSTPAGDDVPFNRAFDKACHCRTHSLLAVPIRDSAGRVLGAITAANSAKGAFSQDDQWFMERFAVQAALAADKALLPPAAQNEDQDRAGAAGAIPATSPAVGLRHSLKNITHILLGTAYIIRRASSPQTRAGGEDSAAHAWEILDRQVRRLAELCNDL